MARVRNWMQRVNGVSYLSGSDGRLLRDEHRSETGAVFCFRYPPRAAFGLAPHPDWLNIRVVIDGGSEIVAGLGVADSQWIGLAAGEYLVEVVSLQSGVLLLTVGLPLEPSAPRIVDIFPRRHRGLLPGYVGPTIGVE